VNLAINTGAMETTAERPVDDPVTAIHEPKGRSIPYNALLAIGFCFFSVTAAFLWVAQKLGIIADADKEDSNQPNTVETFHATTRERDGPCSCYCGRLFGPHRRSRCSYLKAIALLNNPLMIIDIVRESGAREERRRAVQADGNTEALRRRGAGRGGAARRRGRGAGRGLDPVHPPVQEPAQNSAAGDTDIWAWLDYSYDANGAAAEGQTTDIDDLTSVESD
jgi:hypothetical protein